MLTPLPFRQASGTCAATRQKIRPTLFASNLRKPIVSPNTRAAIALALPSAKPIFVLNAHHRF